MKKIDKIIDIFDAGDIELAIRLAHGQSISYKTLADKTIRSNSNFTAELFEELSGFYVDWEANRSGIDIYVIKHSKTDTQVFKSSNEKATYRFCMKRIYKKLDNEQIQIFKTT